MANIAGIALESFILILTTVAGLGHPLLLLLFLLLEICDSSLRLHLRLLVLCLPPEQRVHAEADAGLHLHHQQVTFP